MGLVRAGAGDLARDGQRWEDGSDGKKGREVGFAWLCGCVVILVDCGLMEGLLLRRVATFLLRMVPTLVPSS